MEPMSDEHTKEVILKEIELQHSTEVFTKQETKYKWVPKKDSTPDEMLFSGILLHQHRQTTRFNETGILEEAEECNTVFLKANHLIHLKKMLNIGEYREMPDERDITP